MSRVARIAAASLLALVMLAPGALAHRQVTLDGDDTPGPLDIVAARVGHRSFEKKTVNELYLKLVTYEKWDAGAILGGHKFISFEFDVDGDRRVDRCLVIQYESSASEPDVLVLKGRVFKRCTYFDDEKVGTVWALSRPDDHSVTARARRVKILGRGVKSFRWRAATAYQDESSSECPVPEPHGDGGSGTCTDFTRWKRHESQ